MSPLVSCFATLTPNFLHNHFIHPSLAKFKLIAPSLKQLQVLERELCQLENMLGHHFPNKLKKDVTQFFLQFI